MSTVAVVGSGLVGSLMACILAKRGFHVNLYEMREDIRTMEVVKGKSINLALSERGRSALRLLNLEDEVINNNSIAMNARLIHNKDGKRNPIPYGKPGQCIYSVGRRYLNEILLNEAQKYPNLKIHFNHKLVSCDFENGKLSFMNNGKLVTANADIILGADGAHSAVRREMIKRTPIDFNQTYIEHGYMELCIQATHENEFAMEVNYLHIWPRGTLMMIALPNQDKSYTVTLFMPFKQFQTLRTPEQLIKFFETNFRDAIPLIGVYVLFLSLECTFLNPNTDDTNNYSQKVDAIWYNKLVEDYFNSTPSALISIKCKPYNFGHKALIIGDAAHAMVPFFGQGMNCGFEDCLIIDEILNANGNNLREALPQFTRKRSEDAFTICDLAMYNYIEMRDLVNNRTFLLRKKFDSIMNSIFGYKWIPLYSMVTFTRTPYSQCVKKRKFQDKVINVILNSTVFGIMAISSVLILRRCNLSPRISVSWR